MALGSRGCDYERSCWHGRLDYDLLFAAVLVTHTAGRLLAQGSYP